MAQQTAEVANLVSIMTGSESFSDCSAKAQVYAVPAQNDNFVEQPLWVPKLAEARSDIRKISSTKTPAANGTREELGSWITTMMDLPDGLILKLFVSVHEGWSARKMNGSIFVVTRSLAPQFDITYRLSRSSRANLNEGHLVGRFDILSLEDAELLLKHPVPPQYRSFFDRPTMERTLITNIRETQEGISAPVVNRETISLGGEQMVVATKRRRRHIKL